MTAISAVGIRIGGRSTNNGRSTFTRKYAMAQPTSRPVTQPKATTTPVSAMTSVVERAAEVGDGWVVRRIRAALLRSGGAPDTGFFRSITWAHVHALPASAMQTPDGVADPHAVIEISVPDGALSERRKAGLVEETTKLVLDATGWDPGASWRVWTLIRDVPEGNWGAGGQIVRFSQLREHRSRVSYRL